MEVSQNALAMMLIAGFPVGVMLNLAYSLTDIGVRNRSFAKQLICNLKDFAFMLIAGFMAVLLVYYVNDGEFRYLVVMGLIGGYVASHAALGRLVIRIRNKVARAMSVPFMRLWRVTFGRLYEKRRTTALFKGTQSRAEQLMLLASNGFEN